MTNDIFWSVTDLTVRRPNAGNRTDLHTDRPILSGVELSLAPHDVLAVVGPSGAGKTTLLRAVNMLDPAQSGEIRFAGEVWALPHISARRAQAYRQQTGFVFQDYQLFANRTVLENITDALRYGHGVGKDIARECALALLSEVGLAGFETRYPSALSGGQQQRAAIARALAPDPKLLFLDEPTSALDPQHRRELLTLLQKLAEAGRTMVIVTHDIPFAAALSTRAAFLSEGRIVETGPSAKLLTSPENPQTQAFLASEAAMRAGNDRA